MSGGLAFVLDEDGSFRARVNPAMLDQLERARRGRRDRGCATWSPSTCERTGSTVGAAGSSTSWDALLPRFVKVFPSDYKRVLAELAPSAARRRPTAREVALA